MIGERNEPIRYVDAAYPLRVQVNGETVYIWDDEARAIDAKILDKNQITTAAGTTGTAYSWRKQTPWAGGTFVDSDDEVRGSISVTPISWPAFCVDSQANVGDYVRLYPGYRDTRSPGSNYDIEWYFWKNAGLTVGGKFGRYVNHHDVEDVSHIDFANYGWNFSGLDVVDSTAWDLIEGTDRVTLALKNAYYDNPGIVSLKPQRLGRGPKIVDAIGISYFRNFFDGTTPYDAVADSNYSLYFGIGENIVAPSYNTGPTVALTRGFSYGAPVGGFGSLLLASIFTSSGEPIYPVYGATSFSELWGASLFRGTRNYARMVFTSSSNGAFLANGFLIDGGTYSRGGGGNYQSFSYLPNEQGFPFHFAESVIQVGSITIEGNVAVLEDFVYGVPGAGDLSTGKGWYAKSSTQGNMKFVKGLYVGGNLSVNLATQVTGILSSGNGGSGQSTMTSGQLIIGNGSGPFLSVPTTRTTPGGYLQFRIGTNLWLEHGSKTFN